MIDVYILCLHTYSAVRVVSIYTAARDSALLRLQRRVEDQNVELNRLRVQAASSSAATTSKSSQSQVSLHMLRCSLCSHAALACFAWYFLPASLVLLTMFAFWYALLLPCCAGMLGLLIAQTLMSADHAEHTDHITRSCAAMSRGSFSVPHEQLLQQLTEQRDALNIDCIRLKARYSHAFTLIHFLSTTALHSAPDFVRCSLCVLIVLFWNLLTLNMFLD